jgi:hypothetical protein
MTVPRNRRSRNAGKRGSEHAVCSKSVLSLGRRTSACRPSGVRRCRCIPGWADRSRIPGSPAGRCRLEAEPNPVTVVCAVASLIRLAPRSIGHPPKAVLSPDAHADSRVYPPDGRPGRVSYRSGPSADGQPPNAPAAVQRDAADVPDVVDEHPVRLTASAVLMDSGTHGACVRSLLQFAHGPSRATPIGANNAVDGMRIAQAHQTHSWSCHGQNWAAPPLITYAPGSTAAPGAWDTRNSSEHHSPKYRPPKPIALRSIFSPTSDHASHRSSVASPGSVEPTGTT